jgi:putative ABC transport system substrate-binding protein
MRRREFIAAIAGTALRPIAARAQQSNKVARIGFLNTASLESPDGQNVFLEVRAANSKIERFPALASELVGLNLDVIACARPSTRSMSASCY